MFPMCVVYLQLSSKEAIQRVLKGEKPSEALGKEKKKRSEVLLAPVRPLACTCD